MRTWLSGVAKPDRCCRNRPQELLAGWFLFSENFLRAPSNAWGVGVLERCVPTACEAEHAPPQSASRCQKPLFLRHDTAGGENATVFSGRAYERGEDRRSMKRVGHTEGTLPQF